MQKKAQVIDTATGVIVGVAVAVLLVFAVLLGISSLKPSTFFTAGTTEALAMNQSTANFSYGIMNFFAQIPTAMTVLGVVLILGFIGLMIAIVLRFRSSAGGGGL